MTSLLAEDKTLCNLLIETTLLENDLTAFTFASEISVNIDLCNAYFTLFIYFHLTQCCRFNNVFLHLYSALCLSQAAYISSSCVTKRQDGRIYTVKFSLKITSYSGVKNKNKSFCKLKTQRNKMFNVNSNHITIISIALFSRFIPKIE